MDRRDFFYPFYGQMPSTSYLQDLSQEPAFWPGLSPEQRTPESHLPLSYTRSPPVSANISGESQQSPCSSNSDDSPDAVSASRTEQQGRKSYEKWSEEEKSCWSAFGQTISTCWRAKMLGKFGSGLLVS